MAGSAESVAAFWSRRRREMVKCDNPDIAEKPPAAPSGWIMSVFGFDFTSELRGERSRASSEAKKQTLDAKKERPGKPGRSKIKFSLCRAYLAAVGIASGLSDIEFR
jgi:hypothetical protein